MITQDQKIAAQTHGSPKRSAVCEVRGVSKRFGSMRVLEGINLTLEKAEAVALMGPSGSGKSTLLNCLSGIDKPDEGMINIGDLDVTAASATQLAAMRRETTGTVFQFFHLLPTVTAYENIEFSLQLNGVPAPERQGRVEELLDAVHLTTHRNAFPDTMSGGERQRVAIARALAHRPRLLFADEPTGSLDSRTGRVILDLLTELTDRFEIAMLLVTHSEETAAVCTRTVHLRDGRII